MNRTLMLLRFISVGMSIVVAGLRMCREIRELARSEVAEAATELGLAEDDLNQENLAAATLRRWQMSTPRPPGAAEMERTQQQFNEALRSLTKTAQEAVRRVNGASGWLRAERDERDAPPEAVTRRAAGGED